MFNARTLTAVLMALAVPTGYGQAPAPASATNVTMYKLATCGCCAMWADHLRKAGFKVSATDVPDLAAVKRANRVPASVQTCHTALIDGYVVEGHVPMDAIRKLLRERPKIAGIGVAGMPVGSPGMENGSRHDPYDVLAFDRDGKTSVYLKK